MTQTPKTLAQDATHVHLDIGQSGLVARFVPEGMDAWFARNASLPVEVAEDSRSLGVIAVDRRVFTGTLGLALCNPLTDGIRARNLLDAEDAENPHLPGIYTQRLVIGNSTPADRREGN